MKHEWCWVVVVRGEQNMGGGQSWWEVVHKMVVSKLWVVVGGSGWW